MLYASLFMTMHINYNIIQKSNNSSHTKRNFISVCPPPHTHTHKHTHTYVYSIVHLGKIPCHINLFLQKPLCSHAHTVTHYYFVEFGFAKHAQNTVEDRGRRIFLPNRLIIDLKMYPLFHSVYMLRYSTNIFDFNYSFHEYFIFICFPYRHFHRSPTTCKSEIFVINWYYIEAYITGSVDTFSDRESTDLVGRKEGRNRPRPL